MPLSGAFSISPTSRTAPDTADIGRVAGGLGSRDVLARRWRQKTCCKCRRSAIERLLCDVGGDYDSARHAPSRSRRSCSCSTFWSHRDCCLRWLRRRCRLTVVQMARRRKSQGPNVLKQQLHVIIRWHRITCSLCFVLLSKDVEDTFVYVISLAPTWVVVWQFACWTGHLMLCAKAEKMKSQTLHKQRLLRAGLGALLLLTDVLVTLSLTLQIDKPTTVDEA